MSYRYVPSVGVDWSVSPPALQVALTDESGECPPRVINPPSLLPSYASPAAQFLQPVAGQPTGFLIPANTCVTVGSPPFVWQAAADMTIADAQTLLDVGTSFTPGRDYYAFLVMATPGTVNLVVSLDVNGPAGAAAGTFRLIGGFHTLCVAVNAGLTYVRGGITVPHSLAGFAAGSILPQSFWDLKHRPRSDRILPVGMVYEKYLGIWVDIYLQSGTGTATVSAFQGGITNTRQYVDHVEDMGCCLDAQGNPCGKILLSDEEFAMMALGANEQTLVNGASQTAAQSGGAGGRSDTAGRRMISDCGCEEPNGSMWQWLRTFGAGSLGAQNITGATQIENPWSTGVGMGTVPQDTAPSQPRAQSGGKGQFYGVQTPLLAGGSWANPAAAVGSRSRDGTYARSSANATVGGRGRVRAGP